MSDDFTGLYQLLIEQQLETGDRNETLANLMEKNAEN